MIVGWGAGLYDSAGVNQLPLSGPTADTDLGPYSWPGVRVAGFPTGPFSTEELRWLSVRA